MLFVSASGGGIRAAYWTAMVLNCLFSPNPVQQECAGDPLDLGLDQGARGPSGPARPLTPWSQHGLANLHRRASALDAPVAQRQ